MKKLCAGWLFSEIFSMTPIFPSALGEPARKVRKAVSG